MISMHAGLRIWLVAGITDTRNGFNGLQNVLKNDPFSGHLFIFRGRLERGCFVWPVTRDGKVHSKRTA